MMTEREHRLIFCFTLGTLSREQLAAQYPADTTQLESLAWQLFEAAERERDALGVAASLLLVNFVGLTPAYGPELLRLALADWHGSHEDVLDALETLRLPESVDVLRRMALTQFTTRGYDEGVESLAGKVMYALGALGSPAAIDALVELVRTGNEIVSGQARDQLVMLAGPHNPNEAERRSAQAALAKLG